MVVLPYLCDGVLHDEDVCDGAELAEVLLELLGGRLPGEPADEEFAR